MFNQKLLVFIIIFALYCPRVCWHV